MQRVDLERWKEERTHKTNKQQEDKCVFSICILFLYCFLSVLGNDLNYLNCFNQRYKQRKWRYVMKCFKWHDLNEFKKVPYSKL